MAPRRARPSPRSDPTLDRHTVTLLEQHQAAQATVAGSRRLPAPVYVFSHDAGVEPWRPGYVGAEFRRYRNTVEGGAHVRFHDLRHHVATAMLADGEHPIDVAAQLGHATPATTLRTYAHYLPGRGARSARKRAKRLDG